MNFDYQIFFMPDMKVNEVVTENEDGSYTIFINNNLCDDKKLKSINHAFNHIMNDDFRKNCIQQIECKAHMV